MKIILFTEPKFYKVNFNKLPSGLAPGPTKWLKVFKELSSKLNAEMYSYRPSSHSQRPHSNDIRLINENQIKSMNFDLAYIYRDTGLEIYNSSSCKARNIYMFAENDRFNNDYSNVSIMGHCSVNTFLHRKMKGRGNILTPNICNGVMLKNLPKVKLRNKVVFIGRLSGNIIPKVDFLARTFPDIIFDLYITKFWNIKAKKWVGLGPHQKDRAGALKLFHSQLPYDNINLKDMLLHKDLYNTLAAEGYKAGLVPSIYPLDNRRVTIQINSSSKFYDYIGAGIPVLVESIVPENHFVNKTKYIGISYDKSYGDLKVKFDQIINKRFDNSKILSYANKNHFADSRAEEILRAMK